MKTFYDYLRRLFFTIGLLNYYLYCPECYWMGGEYECYRERLNVCVGDDHHTELWGFNMPKCPRCKGSLDYTDNLDHRSQVWLRENDD